MTNPRHDFPDTAYWVPALKTDKQGRAVVRVPIPDNLTTWRVTVRAVTPQTQVGEGIIKVISRQPLIVRPILPTNLVSGDRFQPDRMGAELHRGDSNNRSVSKVKRSRNWRP